MAGEVAGPVEDLAIATSFSSAVTILDIYHLDERVQAVLDRSAAIGGLNVASPSYSRRAQVASSDCGTDATVPWWQVEPRKPVLPRSDDHIKKAPLLSICRRRDLLNPEGEGDHDLWDFDRAVVKAQDIPAEDDFDIGSEGKCRAPDKFVRKRPPVCTEYLGLAGQDPLPLRLATLREGALANLEISSLPDGKEGHPRCLDETAAAQTDFMHWPLPYCYEAATCKSDFAVFEPRWADDERRAARLKTDVEMEGLISHV